MGPYRARQESRDQITYTQSEVDHSNVYMNDENPTTRNENYKISTASRNQMATMMTITPRINKKKHSVERFRTLLEHLWIPKSTLKDEPPNPKP